MAKQIAEVERVRSSRDEVTAPLSRRSKQTLGEPSPTVATRGIVIAVLIAGQFWALLALFLYLLI
jgi:hypothetical protein